MEVPRSLPARSAKAGSAGILPASSRRKARATINWLASQRFLSLAAIAIVAFVVCAIAFKPAWLSSLSAASPSSIDTDNFDHRLQEAATLALGDRRGSVVVMDPQTGRIRAVVNPEIAFGESFPLGSAIKPFTALAALTSGVIDDDSRTLCHEKYSHHAFQTTCSHPRDLPPLNPVEAIAYSCNYYFSTVGERLTETSFSATLGEFGFGRKTGVNAKDESQGQLQRSDWRPQNAIGEGNYLQATPIQLVNAYTALVNGGRLFTPRLSAARDFVSDVQSKVEIRDRDREVIVNGMRGAVRYGSAEKANLYSLPAYVFGKTGTATEINGFRTHGWFVGFASQMADKQTTDSEAAPEKVNLAVLVFLAKGHGFEAAQVSRLIFEVYARSQPEITTSKPQTQSRSEGTEAQSVSTPARVSESAPQVRVHLVRENITRTMPIEDYVRGVVAAEGSMEQEPEALKALAIASRTFILKNLGRHERDGYDFCTSTHCQRYREVRSDSPDDVAPAITEAVEATKGEVIRDDHDQLADSYFSASCGGATANAATLWGGNAPPYLQGVRDEYCPSEAHHSWTDVISQAQLLKALQSDPRTNIGGHLVNVSVLRTDATGRAELITIEGNRRIVVKGWDFKIIVGRALGWNLLKSSRFEIAHSGANFIFRGSGFGHGLGLCQEGAHVMATRGASYRQILRKYFPSTRVANEFSSASADLMWELPKQNPDRQGGPRGNKLKELGTLPDGRGSAWVTASLHQNARESRHSLASENFRVNYPDRVSQPEVEALLTMLQSSRRSLIARVAAAGITARLPTLQIFVNETTGDFVGRTGLPSWAAAATRGNQIEIQPLATLKRRGILETTLRHELVHAVVDAVSHERAPRWLAEGLALHFAGEGRMITRYQPRQSLTTAEIEKRLGYGKSTMTENEMRSVYAAAYGEVKRLIASEGETKVWRRVTR